MTPTSGARVRLHIDWTRCDARGLCAELLPELLATDRSGYPVPRTGPEPEIPPPLTDLARQAVRDCPRLALSLLPSRRPS